MIHEDEEHACLACEREEVASRGDLCPECKKLLTQVSDNRRMYERLLQIQGGWPSMYERVFTSEFCGRHFIDSLSRSEAALRQHGRVITWAPIEAVLYAEDSEINARRNALGFRFVQLPCTLEWNSDLPLTEDTPVVCNRGDLIYWPDFFYAFDYIVDVGDDGHTVMERKGSICLLRSEIRDLLMVYPIQRERVFERADQYWRGLRDDRLQYALAALEYAFFPIAYIRKAFQNMASSNYVIGSPPPKEQP